MSTPSTPEYNDVTQAISIDSCPCSMKHCDYQGQFMCDGCSISCCLGCGHITIIMINSNPYRLQLCPNCNIGNYHHLDMRFK